MNKFLNSWLNIYRFSEPKFSIDNANISTKLEYNLIEESGKLKLQDNIGNFVYLVFSTDIEEIEIGNIKQLNSIFDYGLRILRIKITR